MIEFVEASDRAIPKWRVAAMDKILLSGFILCLCVCTLALYLFVVFQTPMWHAWMAALFGVSMLLCRLLLNKYLHGSAIALIVIMYVGAAAAKNLVQEPILADFGILFLYAIPLLALLLISPAVANFLKLANLFPFGFVIISHVFFAEANNLLPAFNYIYLHSLMFVFFNLILPFAMQQMVKEATQTANVRRKANQTNISRKNLYQTLFKSSRQASLIVRHTDNTIVDSNDALRRVLYGNALLQLRDFILNQNMKVGQAYEITLVNRHFVIWRKSIGQTDSCLYVLEEVTQLKRLTEELTELTQQKNKIEEECFGH